MPIFDINKKYICTRTHNHVLVRFVKTFADGTYRFAMTGCKYFEGQVVDLRPGELCYIKTIGAHQ